MKNIYLSAVLFASVSLVACGGDDGGGANTETDAQFQAAVVTGMHDTISTELQKLITAAQALQAAAPDHPWDKTADADAITAMKAAWQNTRIAYEHVEGATAPIFPDLDVTMDERYDGFLANELHGQADPDLFDDQGVTGMHAIERILYQPDTRQVVINFEAAQPGYTAASFPLTQTQADEFKNKLCQKLIDDAQKLHDQWVPWTMEMHRPPDTRFDIPRYRVDVG